MTDTAAAAAIGAATRELRLPVIRTDAERLAEIAQRRAQPAGLAAEMTSRFLYAPESPFSRPLGGTEASVEQLTTQDVRSFHAARYLAPAATLVVTGDLGADEAVELAERHFGDWASGAFEVAAADAAPRSRERRVVIVDRPGSVQSEIRVAQVGPARDTPDYFPLIVMNTILGGAFTSRLNLNLREQRGFTYGVSSGFAMRRQPGPFLVSTAVQTEVTPDAVREIFHELDGIRDAAVRPEELDDARSYLAGIFPLRLQTTAGVAARLVDLAVYDLPDDYLDHYRDRVTAVTADEVLRAAREYVHPDEMLALVVGDADSIRGPLEALGLGPVTVVDARGEPR
jgi:zinc protease